MKITALRTQNFLGASAVDVHITKPVCLFAGKNYAGKSSLQEAVRMALTGESVRVGLKKDYGSLVTDGHETGLVEVEAGGINHFVMLPKGEMAVGKALTPHAAVPYVLDGQRFARMTPEERRGFLFGLMGLSAGGDEVRKRLAARGCDPERAEKIMPMLRAGFDAAAKEAATKAREAKAAWREITGETYGEKKAEGWAAPAAAAVTDEAVQEQVAALEAAEAALAEANREAGAIEDRCRQHQHAQQRVAGLREKVERRQRIVEKLKRDRADLAEWEPKLASVQAAAAPRVGLVHELGWAVNNLIAFGDVLDPEKNPDDARVLAARDAYLSEYGHPALQTTAPHPEVSTKRQQYEKAVALYRSSVANGERDLADVDAAAAALAQLEEAGPAPAASDLDAATRRVADAKAARAAAAAALERLQESDRAARHAQEKAARAAAAHQAALAWTAIVDALAPNGIPGEMLADALDPINERLMRSSATTEWLRVGIEKDMAVTGGGRPYALLSESEKWRADAMIAEAIAHLSGLRLLVLDRLDVLDLEGRGDLLYWLDTLATEGEIDTALVFATLKAPPAGLPETVQSVWIENGVAGRPRAAA